MENKQEEPLPPLPTETNGSLPPLPNKEEELSNDENPIDVFNNMLKKNPQMIIYFSASWCGPCKQVEPFVTNLTLNLNHKVGFIKLDLDQHEELADHLNVKKVPTIFSFIDGKESEKVEGAKPELIQKLFDKTEAQCLF